MGGQLPAQQRRLEEIRAADPQRRDGGVRLVSHRGRGGDRHQYPAPVRADGDRPPLALGGGVAVARESRRRRRRVLLNGSRQPGSPAASRSAAPPRPTPPSPGGG